MSKIVWCGEREVAQLVGRSVRTVQYWRQSNTGPPYYRMCGCIRYRHDEIEAWLAAQHVVPQAA